MNKEIIEDVDLTKPTLLCISDLEGCSSESLAKIPQSQTLCKLDTFTAIEKLMVTYESLQVVFLGDYFDQGPMIRESIRGIIMLKEKAEIKDRVHIILGNRDINKMRIGVEALENTIPSTFKWIRDIDIVDIFGLDDTPLNKTKKLLAKTYGAPNLLKYVGLNGDEQNGLDVLIKIFNDSPIINSEPVPSPPNQTGGINVTDEKFIEDCRNLFKYAKLIEIINIGGTNVLVSHAGTYNVEMFTPDVIKNNSKLSNITYNASSYFNDIENVRQVLEYSNDDNKDITLTPNIEKSIIYYNGVLNNFIESIKNNLYESIKKDSELYTQYLLLQALGLKPTDGKKFLSPIESCSLNGGCQKITKPDPNFIELLKNNNIKCVAHGHVPFCTTVPLIRKETNVWFLSCDTSNGSRPKYKENELALNQVPLGYIQEDGVGIASINETTLSPASTLGVSMDGTDNNYYKFMVKHFKFEEDKPVVQYNDDNIGSVVEYPEKKLIMDSKNMFKPTYTPEPGQFGGKSRKNKKNTKSNKSNKKGGLKKLTRKLKLKLKSQKIAYAKSHCRDCK